MAGLMVEGFDAADPKLASARAIADEWGGAEMGASQPRPGCGYGELLAWLAGSLDPRVKLRLQCVVREVSWRRGRVEVRGAFLGKPFAVRARQAIVTLPVGVLQAGSVRFRPALREKNQALLKLASGPVVKLALRFDSPFWEERHPDVSFFHSPGDFFPTFWNQLPRHAPYLIAWAGGPKADAHSLSLVQSFCFTLPREQPRARHASAGKRSGRSMRAQHIAPAGGTARSSASSL